MRFLKRNAFSPKKIAIVLLALGIFGLQIRLWFLDGNLAGIFRIQKEVTIQQKAVAQLKNRNQLLEAEIQNLKNRLDALEERARVDLGMIGQEETFFQVIAPK